MVFINKSTARISTKNQIIICPVVTRVFGDALPSNDIINDAGLDVSPAVRDFLELNDIDTVDWQFVNFNDVPHGF